MKKKINKKKTKCFQKAILSFFYLIELKKYIVNNLSRKKSKKKLSILNNHCQTFL